MKVDLIKFPFSQGCIGCPHAGSVSSQNVQYDIDSSFICLAEDRSKVFCDNPEML